MFWANVKDSDRELAAPTTCIRKKANSLVWGSRIARRRCWTVKKKKQQQQQIHICGGKKLRVMGSTPATA